LFNFHTFRNILLLSTSVLIMLWWGKILGGISVLLHLLRLIYNIPYGLVTVPHTKEIYILQLLDLLYDLGLHIFFFFFGWGAVLWFEIWARQLLYHLSHFPSPVVGILFSSSRFFLIFFFWSNLSIIEEMLKSTMIVSLSFYQLGLFFLYAFWGADIFIIIILMVNFSLTVMSCCFSQVQYSVWKLTRSSVCVERLVFLLWKSVWTLAFPSVSSLTSCLVQ
jgi:hypothetical protein